MRRKRIGRGRSGYVPLVEVWRGDAVESIHFGAIAVVGPDGRLRRGLGDPRTLIFLRSAAKPAQVLPLLASGAADRFGLTEAEIAVIIGSHNGESAHLEAVRSILARIGLDETALQCGAHPPYHRPTAADLRRQGLAPTVLHNNCSGKHAGMLALAVHLGAPTSSYLAPGHPVQKRIRAVVETLAGVRPGGAVAGVDGCSAPTFGLPLHAAARLFGRLAAAAGARAKPLPVPGVGDVGDAMRRAVGAMRAHPEMVAGDDRPCTALMRSGRRSLIAKIGAEGVYGLGYLERGGGVGLAVKIADGDGSRARTTVAIELLRRCGVLPAGDAKALASRFVGEVKNHRGTVVGRVVPAFVL